MVKFVCGLQNNQNSKSVENETDWSDIMFIILRNLEKYPMSVDKIHHFITKDIESWMRVYEAPQNLKISIKIEENLYFSEPYGSKKRLTLSFSDY